MIPCPRCGSRDVASLSRHGATRPKLVGHVVIRHHRCQSCGNRFRSYQIAAYNRATAEALEDAMIDVA